MSTMESITEQPCQEEVLDFLADAWAKHPGLRLVQLIDYSLECVGLRASFYADNRTLIAALKKAAKKARIP